jgi:hypothetical protein
MKSILSICFIIHISVSVAQLPVSLKDYNAKNGATVSVARNIMSVKWPAGNQLQGQLNLDLNKNKPLFARIAVIGKSKTWEIGQDLDPAFLLTVGKRDLVSQNGWNIFFDKVPLKPFKSHVIAFDKKSAAVSSIGSRTVITIDEVTAPDFKGNIQITFYNGSPLFNIAAVISTAKDSTAILYDAGLVSKRQIWRNISFAEVTDKMKTVSSEFNDTSTNEAVKYRTVIGSTGVGSLSVFPAPHQYFYPLDEAFNLKFVWYGNNYRKMIDGYGLGIRQDLYGDKRFVPWFNSPPGTEQRLNFFCLLNNGTPANALDEVKKFTHNDTYVSLPGYKKMASHFHNEFIMRVVMANKPVPDSPSFVQVFKKAGIDIVHLGEFHYTAHPKGPDELRLKELHALFEQCRRLSSDNFLLLPGEEPNEFFGGHWLEFFPKPIYWIMSRKEGQPFVTKDSLYGTVYRIGNATEMLELLNREKGLAWTAHPRTKGSTGFPDKYKDEIFFKSDRFLGAAWKPIPADLSHPRLGKRVLDLLDDMNNWGTNKKVLAEADLFTIEHENEMYAHMNVNYMQLGKLPAFNEGWQSIIDALQNGKFFSTTGEVLIPSFTVNNKTVSDTALLNNGKADISFKVQWTFPLQFAEIISGDGTTVYRDKINLDTTLPFGEQTIRLQLNLPGRKWMRLEVWDVAVNGAFTQTIWLK